MGEVITEYLGFFQAVRAFNARPVEERSKIADHYFGPLMARQPTIRAQLRLSAYACRVRSMAG